MHWRGCETMDDPSQESFCLTLSQSHNCAKNCNQYKKHNVIASNTQKNTTLAFQYLIRSSFSKCFFLNLTSDYRESSKLPNFDSW